MNTRSSLSRILTISILFISIITISSCLKTNQPDAHADTLTHNFQHVPDNIQTSVYWYWINGNVSKEGVIADLESMKAVGINRAFIGNIGLTANECPYGPVKVLSDEWWDITHAALKKATELNIEIGMFNCPGWSQSGGPWVKPSQAMRYLNSSETVVTGPLVFNDTLSKPADEFQDVKVLAYPLPDVTELAIKLTSTPAINNLSNTTDNNPTTFIDLPTGGQCIFDFAITNNATARSLTITPAARPININATLQYIKDGQFETFKNFNINRSNASVNVGFAPYGPIAISIPDIQSDTFRLILNNPNPGSALAEIKLSATPVLERYVEKSLAKMFQTPLPYWHEYQWPTPPAVENKNALIKPDSIIDISKFMTTDGRLTWQVPTGKWKIVRFGMTPTGTYNEPAAPEATGPEVDKINKEHLVNHFNSFIGQILERIPAQDRKTFKVVVQDSYEKGSVNFTDDFIAKFKDAYGYDPLPYLPVYTGAVVGSQEQSDRFLWDLRRFVADRVSYEFVAGFREISNKHGLNIWLENYGHWGFPGEFLQYGGQSNEIGGEFWNEGELGNIECRAASSCAHIYGKTKVSAESFTSAGQAYARHPALLKRRGDWSFTEGINNTLLHVYISQPDSNRLPGVNAWFGTEFNRKNTWFYDMDLFVTYMKRCNFMLQQGQNVADVAYFIGEDAPKMTGVRDPELPRGYSFDYINAEVILNRLAVEDGRFILPDGTSYALLVLPKLDTMRPELLAKIKTLVEQGGIIYGPAPSRSPSLTDYPNADKHVDAMAKELWDLIDTDPQYFKHHDYGKGRIFNNMSLQHVFNEINLTPDCQFTKNDNALYLHRRQGDQDIYFISNQLDKTVELFPNFRVTGKQPELFQATDGSIRTLPEFTTNDNHTTVPLTLAPYESAFIVFRSPITTTESKPNFPTPTLVKALDDDWQILFDVSKAGPANPVTFESLQDWTQNENPNIKYYSGTARYSTTFTLDKIPAGQTLYLDFDRVGVIAKVTLNGQYLGGTWTQPYRVNITPALKTGINALEITVSNTWVNRLIGEKNLPEDQRFTWTPNNPWAPNSPLQPSGLIGKASIIALDY